ncbi:hypothetical protein ACF0H5_018332 [Mactra antiquata]
MYSTVRRWTVFVVLSGMCIYSTGKHLTTNVIWESCNMTVCGPRYLTITCELGSKILISNVTSGNRQEYAESGYANLRRMCMGMNQCNASRQGFCTQFQGTFFNVSYICIPDKMINNDCLSTGRELTEKTGFITSPNYPAQTNFRKCKWKIRVPEDHYVHVYLHEVLYTVREPVDCTDGLRFSALNTCGMQFPTYHVCKETDITTTVSACTDLEILLPSASQEMRFWASYSVVKVRSLDQVSMYNTSLTCYLKTKSEFTYLPPPTISVVQSVNVTSPPVNSTVIADASQEEENESVDYVMIIGLAVGVIVIITILVIALIYLRCKYLVIQQERQESKMDISKSISQVNCSEIQKRPLPETQSDGINGEGQPVLQQSYSEVKDHIPISEAPPEHVISPTYAEIEEIEPTKPNPKLPLAAKRSVDNSKRELPAKPPEAEAAHSSTYSEIEVDDAKDAESEKDLNAKNKKNKEKIFPNYFYKKKLSNASNIYAECEDVSKVDKDKTYMDMSHKKIEESEYVPHSKVNKDKVNLSKKCKVGDVSDKSTEANIPFADCDTKKKGTTDAGGKTGGKVRKDSVSSDSDSDGDICMVENALYEPFETAKV